MKTLITEILDKNCVTYVLKTHMCDALTCEDVARERNVTLPQVLKCMVGKDRDNNIYVMLIPGDKFLEIKKIRKIAETKVSLIPSNELKMSLGLTVGAISPIHFVDMAKKGKAKYFLDDSVLAQEEIDISAGFLNAGILLNTNDLINLISPKVCSITHP